ncbi:LysR family transcriptional regulator [Roseibium sp. SCP14]|uniref:LysR family transcriptional regulator n=1 Tax=Roseibium sp. SCP14 TaxID=3141375 RepID=UPI00333CFE06
MAVAPPRPKWPPLNSLRAFEAAARLQSFTSAADELCVTPGAVAQHIKSLEAQIGEKLFVRHAKGVELTRLGASILPAFVQAFDALGLAVHSLRSNAASTEIRIAALPSLSQLWLSSRLPNIRKAIPDSSISITALETKPNLNREPFDLAIFFEDLPGSTDAVELGRDIIYPVCAPELAATLSDPQDLSTVPCLHDTTWSNDWSIWCEATQSGDTIDHHGPAFSLYSLALEEAKNGAGVLMGHDALVRDSMANGSLVKPFDIEVRLPRRIAIFQAQTTADTPEITKIIEQLAL